MSSPGTRSAEALTRLLQVLLAVVHTRGRLLVTELEEERAVLEARLVFAIVAVGAAGFALLLFTLLGIVAFWDTHRLEAIGVAAALYTGVAAFAGWRARAIGQAKPPPFSATLGELEKDRLALRDGALVRRVAEVSDAAERAS